MLAGQVEKNKYKKNLDIGTDGVGAVFCVGFMEAETTERKKDLDNQINKF